MPGPPAAVTIVAPPDGCPSATAIEQALAPLLPGTTFAEGAPDEVRASDLGATFRIDAGGQTRVVDDGARNCAERAVTAAVFVSFVLDPPALPPIPAPTSPPQIDVMTAPPSLASTPWRGAIAAEGLLAASPEGSAVSGGGELRGAYGSERFAATAGVAVLAPTTLAVGAETARLVRVPIDLGARIQLRRAGALGIAGELGAVISPLFVRGEGVANPVSSATFDLGLRAAVRAEWRSAARWVPFAGLEAIASTRHDLVTGMDASRQSPGLWVGLAIGVEASLF